MSEWQPAVIRPREQWCMALQRQTMLPDTYIRISSNAKIFVVPREDADRYCGCPTFWVRQEDVDRIEPNHAGERGYIALCQIATD